MNTLITGADGMLGTSLVHLLLERGHNITAFIHPESKSTTLDNLDIKKVYGDILNPHTLDDAMKEVDVVVHAAASTALWPSRSEFVKKINIEGTRNIIDKVLQHNISKLIYVGSASSVNATKKKYGKHSFPGAKYGLDYIDSKYEAFKEVMKAAKEKNLPVTVILPTFMIGPFDSQVGSGKLLMNFIEGYIKMYPKGGRNFVHVKDVAKSIANSIAKETTGNNYVIGNENMSFKSFLKIAAEVTNKKELKLKSPSWIVLTAGMAGSLYGRILKKEPILTYRMARVSCDKQFVNCANSLKELDVNPTPIKTAIEDSYSWFREHGYCK
jgi:dihydroflavonol-4-reductase